MMVEFEPPLIACVVSEADYSFAALKATRECVIGIPSVKLARKIVRYGCIEHVRQKRWDTGVTPVSRRVAYGN